MNLGLFLGCLFGATVCLLGLALVPPRPKLATTVARWDRQRASAGQSAAVESHDEPAHVRAGRWLAKQLARHGVSLTKTKADLGITHHSLEIHLARKFGYALLGLLFPSFLALIAAAAGVGTSWILPAVTGVVVAVAFFVLPDMTLAREADERRSELRRALSCYLDLVAMSLAGGRGVPEALPTAARIGRGWAFTLLRDTIDRARLVGETPWAAFSELGRRTGMQELEDLGGALSLVADDGAKVRASLQARAATQRRRQLVEAEGAASKADQSMEMAQVVLFLGLMLFLGFPAVVAVMGI